MTPLSLPLLLGALLLQAKPAAPPPELGATVQVAPTGELCGSWQSYVVELDSRTTRELDLLVRIEDDSYLAVATRRERLSPSARKRIFLYAPSAAFQRGVPARYLITDAKGVELAAGTMPNPSRGYAAQAWQVALFCRIPAAEDDFGIPTTINSAELRCGRLTAATFPDRWIGLSSLDALILQDAPLDELTTDQTRALHEYVRMGGTVLLIPGATQGWLQHPAIQALAPVRTEAARTATRLPDLNGAYGDFRGNESFLWSPIANGKPVIGETSSGELARFDAGFGRALVFGVDLRRGPFDTWAGRRSMWTDLLPRFPRWFQEESISFPIASTPAQREDLFQRMGRLINPYPSFALILGLAVVFLGVVGPANYMILWKLRRTLLLVVTVPGISVAFLALIVLLGYVLKGTSTVAHSARLLQTRSGLGVARESHLYSLFSPSTRTYDVAFEPGTYGPFNRWDNGERMHYRRRQESMDAITVDTGSAVAIKGVSTGQWQSWDLETRALRDLGKGIRFSTEGGVLTVANGSSRTIERGLFVQTGIESGAVPFAAVEPGRSLDTRLGPLQRSGVSVFGFAPDSLPDALLRPWLDSLIGPHRIGAPAGPPQRFLICVLKDEGAPVGVDAALSGRSRTVTLLHVAEAP